MPHSKTHCYEFGPFRFNVSQRLLTRDGVVISLGPKATEILLTLLRSAGEIVGKDDLMREVWPDSFVEESNLTQNIFTLRRALGDTRTEARFIETVPRRGYRFVSAVKLVEDGTAVGEAREPGLANSPILAVLPFINATGDEGLEYLADGVCENVINSLSHISKLRVMSRSAVFRYKGRDPHPRVIQEDLGVDVLLLGKITSPPSGLRINATLVNAATGWQLWGESFDCALTEILEIQDEIVRQSAAALGLRLTGDEERRLTARYTENPQAYQAYIEGRFYWSRYTRHGIEKAIERFGKALELDPNYALAYAGIVDCYLRLATNYFPPEGLSISELEHEQAETIKHDGCEDVVRESEADKGSVPKDSDPKIKLRHEWDWKGAEREIRRANELKAEYPAAHQWYAAYLFVRELVRTTTVDHARASDFTASVFEVENSVRIPSNTLTPREEVQVICSIAREQIDIGNYRGACIILSRWWEPGMRPRLTRLDPQSCADLLFTAGVLEGCVASAQQLSIGQKNAETLLSGSIALFEQVGSQLRAAEAKIELALCYYREGKFELGRTTLAEVLNTLSVEECELRCLALIRLASLERHAGRLQDALRHLKNAKSVVKSSGPWVTGRHHLELASTYKDLAISEGDDSLFDKSLEHYRDCLYEFEAIGNLRLLGIAENNLSFLLLNLRRFKESAEHLVRSRRIFEELQDKVRLAQVDDTLARLYIEEAMFDLAELAANRAIETLQAGDEDALLAEVLTTKGIVCSRLGRFGEASRLFERAASLASRCGDYEGAGRALLIMVEEMGMFLASEERIEIGARLRQFLSESQQQLIRERLDRCLKLIESS